MPFWHLDDDPCWPSTRRASQAGRRLVRLIAGNPVTMGQMTRRVPAAGSYAPVTILIQERRAAEPRWPTTAVASAIALYGEPPLPGRQRLDTDVLALLRHATGIPAAASP